MLAFGRVLGLGILPRTVFMDEKAVGTLSKSQAFKG
jgi:hypothetical protein